MRKKEKKSEECAEWERDVRIWCIGKKGWERGQRG